MPLPLWPHLAQPWESPYALLRHSQVPKPGLKVRQDARCLFVAAMILQLVGPGVLVADYPRPLFIALELIPAGAAQGCDWVLSMRACGVSACTGLLCTSGAALAHPITLQTDDEQERALQEKLLAHLSERTESIGASC